MREIMSKGEGRFIRLLVPLPVKADALLVAKA